MSTRARGAVDEVDAWTDLQVLSIETGAFYTDLRDDGCSQLGLADLANVLQERSNGGGGSDVVRGAVGQE